MCARTKRARTHVVRTYIHTHTYREREREREREGEGERGGGNVSERAHKASTIACTQRGSVSERVHYKTRREKGPEGNRQCARTQSEHASTGTGGGGGVIARADKTITHTRTHTHAHTPPTGKVEASVSARAQNEHALTRRRGGGKQSIGVMLCVFLCR